jgi:hypothetical protein
VAAHRTALLLAAVVLIASGVGAFLWRRRIASCATGNWAGKVAAPGLLFTTLAIGSTLAVLGYL